MRTKGRSGSGGPISTAIRRTSPRSAAWNIPPSAAGRRHGARSWKRNSAPPHWQRTSANPPPPATIPARPSARTTIPARANAQAAVTARRKAPAATTARRKAPRRLHRRREVPDRFETFESVARLRLVRIGKPSERWMSAARVTSISAAVLAVFFCTMPAEAARPRAAVFWPFGPWWGDHAPRQHSHRQRHAKPRTKTDQARETSKGPLQIIISIADQRISVYDNGALIGRSSVSTGVPGHPTPVGVFSVISKQRWHRSNLYSAAPMPYMQRITWSGVALHAGVVPGRPASHGCIRLKNDFAIRLWHLTRRGTRVIIAPDDTQPVEVANSRLFAAKPNAASVPPASRAALADNAAMPAAAAQPTAMPDAGTPPVTDKEAADTTQTAAARPKPVPVSVFVSRKAGRLFVRRGFKPLFDSPITIQDPEQPLGTHVFTVMAHQHDGEAPRWTAVSMPEKARPTPETKRHTRGKQIDDAPVPTPDQANAALDRIAIPPDAIERISDLLTPGSSLIVSDYGISRKDRKSGM